MQPTFKYLLMGVIEPIQLRTHTGHVRVENNQASHLSASEVQTWLLPHRCYIICKNEVRDTFSSLPLLTKHDFTLVGTLTL